MTQCAEVNMFILENNYIIRQRFLGRVNKTMVWSPLPQMRSTLFSVFLFRSQNSVKKNMCENWVDSRSRRSKVDCSNAYKTLKKHATFNKLYFFSYKRKQSSWKYNIVEIIIGSIYVRFRISTDIISVFLANWTKKNGVISITVNASTALVPCACMLCCPYFCWVKPWSRQT